MRFKKKKKKNARAGRGEWGCELAAGWHGTEPLPIPIPGRVGAAPWEPSALASNLPESPRAGRCGGQGTATNLSRLRWARLIPPAQAVPDLRHQLRARGKEVAGPHGVHLTRHTALETLSPGDRSRGSLERAGSALALLQFLRRRKEALSPKSFPKVFLQGFALNNFS